MRPFEKHIYLIGRGLSYYHRQNYASALDFYRRSLALMREYPDMEYERNITYLRLSDVFLLLNETDSAKYYLDCCHAFFRETQNRNALYYIDTQLMELALKENKVALAGKYLKKAVIPAYVEPGMVHMRNKYLEHYYAEVGNFKEASHLAGRAGIIDLVRIFEKENPALPMRVDHAPLMLGDEKMGYNAGYSFHGRMLALGQMEGVMAVVDREIAEGKI